VVVTALAVTVMWLELKGRPGLTSFQMPFLKEWVIELGPAYLLLGFVVSGVGHAYPVLVAIDLPTAAMMFAFFLVQGIFVILEVGLGASRWSRPARRVWTVTIMVASSPLFVEPALRVLGRP